MSSHPFKMVRRRAEFEMAGELSAEAEALREHLALPARERLERTLRLSGELRLAQRYGKHSDRPWEFHEEAQRLGLLDKA
ncbi:MAG: hypothetical protein U5Q44_11000 [Dehalococcoidia bacterium]|nr:hypothetical protein [Dehalococcoidia bacterium]